MPVDGGLGALAGDRIEPGRCCDGEMACVCGDEDRGGEGVFTGGFRAGDQSDAGVFGETADGVDLGEDRFPAAMVPVLSNTMVSGVWAVSRACAERMRMPARAPFPVPTMMDNSSKRFSVRAAASTAAGVSVKDCAMLTWFFQVAKSWCRLVMTAARRPRPAVQVEGRPAEPSHR
ncbi:hypothetical protein ACWKSP_33615 [Micromonosporaceae bacterium Da 78-11]